MTNLPALQSALEAEAYDWLMHHAPLILEAVERDMIQQGATPDRVYRFTLSRVGADRSGIAKRCFLAAQHIANNAQPVG